MAIKKPKVTDYGLVGGPFNGKVILMTNYIENTLEFSVKGFKGYYSRNFPNDRVRNRSALGTLYWYSTIPEDIEQLKAEQRRIEQETAEKKKRAKLRQSAYEKLTPDEREALGL